MLKKFLIGVTVVLVYSVVIFDCFNPGVNPSSLGQCLPIKNGEVYYTKEVTELEATAFERFINNSRDNNSPESTFQLDRKQPGSILVRICVKPEFFKSEEVIANYTAIEYLLEQSVFPLSNVVVELTDNLMETQNRIDGHPGKISLGHNLPK